MAIVHITASFLSPLVNLPQDMNTNLLMIFRWLHLVAAITWIGLLYFFNLVNVPFLKELDAPTRSRVFPSLMSKALWWFRHASIATVLAGIAYWMTIVSTDTHNAQTSGGMAIGSFFLIWTITWGILYAILIPGKGALDKGPVIAVLYTVIVLGAAYLYLSLNSHGWESNRLLSIGIGGGIGWMMLLNVWGVIWRIQKRLIQWTQDNATNGTPMPEKAKAMARQAFLVSRANAWLSIPLLFLMGAASHYPMFGK